MKKQRHNTYLHEEQLDALKEMYEKKRITVTALIGMAIDRFLLETGWLDKPVAPPIEMSFLRRECEEDDDES